MTWRDALEQLLSPPLPARSPAPAPVTTVTRTGIVTTNDWGEAIPVYRGQAITVYVATNSALVQFAGEQPPAPPVWLGGGVFVTSLSPWAHGAPFGWVRFKSAVPGLPAVVNFSAYGGG